MSSHSHMPRHLPTDKSPYKLSTTGNIQQATSMVNRMARRDPALYPLSFILVGIAGVTGYFAMQKAFEPDVERRFSQRVNVWDGEEKQDIEPGTVAAFKYRYKTRDGHMEDAMPTMNVEVRKVKDDHHKYHTT